MKRTALALLSLLTLAACGDGAMQKTELTKATDVNGVLTSSKLLLTDYAVRAPLGNNPNTAAYVTIKNGGDSDDRLVSAACDCAATVQLHDMTMKDGVMTMSHVNEGFAVAPGETLTLAPGGKHIMLLGLTERPPEGSFVSVRLTFDKAGPVTLSMPVSSTPLAGKTQAH